MKPGLISEEYISIIIRELLLGLDYLHSDKKLHRDIKGGHYHIVCCGDAYADMSRQLPMFCWVLTGR